MQAQEFYRYKDPQGRIVIVDSLDRVPVAERGKVEKLAFEAPPRPVLERPPLPGIDEAMHWQSFAAGFACAALLGVIVLTLRRFSSPLARVLLLSAGIALAVGAYFGWLRRSTGQGDAAFASPSAVIDDARNAVDAMNRRNEQQKKALDEALRTK